MKKMITIMLAAVLVMSGQQLVKASSDNDDGYRSKFYGTVEKMPTDHVGTWIINGRQVEVTNNTKIEQEYGKVLVGSYVEIKGRSDGKTFHAYELEVKRGDKYKKDSSYNHDSSKGKSRSYDHDSDKDKSHSYDRDSGKDTY